MNVKEKLDKLRFRTFNVHGLITDTREYLDQNGGPIMCQYFVRELIGREVEFQNEIDSRIFVKKLMVELFNANYVINPIEVDNVISDCWEYTNNFMADPNWSFLFSKSDEVTDDGKVISNSFMKPVAKVVKKESKQDIVRRWYKEFVMDGGMASKDFGKKLVDELGMSKAGSLTYVFNAKKFYTEGGVV